MHPKGVARLAVLLALLCLLPFALRPCDLCGEPKNLYLQAVQVPCNGEFSGGLGKTGVAHTKIAGT